MLSAILLSVVFVRAVDAGRRRGRRATHQDGNDWADSYVKRDPSFVQKITTDDFMFVGPDGNIVNRTDYVKGVTGDTTFTAFKITSLKVRVYGDTAVVIGIATIAAKIKGEDESGDYSFTDVFVKQKANGKRHPVRPRRWPKTRRPSNCRSYE